MVPLRDSLWELLYSPDAPQIAEAVIKTYGINLLHLFMDTRTTTTVKNHQGTISKPAEHAPYHHTTSRPLHSASTERCVQGLMGSSPKLASSISAK
ncbi:hypothetical protein TNCV_651611 [Trichonephila clavipes]|nr:hypothetical protein TNCV_651611 [Trichonephila clavipes]